jgi:hypothetical protein
LLIFQNWKFTVGISKGHWLVTLSWRWRQKEPENMTICPMVPLPKTELTSALNVAWEVTWNTIIFSLDN